MEFGETKKFYQKEVGRQYKHIIQSFKAGEVDREKALKIGVNFCEKAFLGDEVFSARRDWKMNFLEQEGGAEQEYLEELEQKRQEILELKLNIKTLQSLLESLKKSLITCSRPQRKDKEIFHRYSLSEYVLWNHFSGRNVFFSIQGG